jgi:hypothetical protein
MQREARRSQARTYAIWFHHRRDVDLERTCMSADARLAGSHDVQVSSVASRMTYCGQTHGRVPKIAASGVSSTLHHVGNYQAGAETCQERTVRESWLLTAMLQ